MPDEPLKRRHPHGPRPPRFERTAELAAFYLGYLPYQIWYAFAEQQEAEPAPASKRWLLDMPVLLAPWFPAEGRERYVTTLSEVLRLFETLPTSPMLADSAPADDQGGSSFRPPSKRFWAIYSSRVYGNHDSPGFALMRLASILGESLPQYLRQWFSFGKTIGLCLSDLKRNGSARTVEMRKAILLSAVGTDFDADESIPDVSEEAYLATRDAGQNASTDHYDEWAYECLQKLATEVEAYLQDEPSIVLDPSSNFLWFLGVHVPLTRTECEVLVTVARYEKDEVPRSVIMREAIDDPEVSGPDTSAHMGKADQYVQAIIGKIVTELQAAKSPFFCGDKKPTREWLRQEFLPSSAGIGWRRGPLFKKLRLKQPKPRPDH